MDGPLDSDEYEVARLRREAQRVLVRAEQDKRAARALTMQANAAMRRYQELNAEANKIARRLAGLPDLHPASRQAV